MSCESRVDEIKNTIKETVIKWLLEKDEFGSHENARRLVLYMRKMGECISEEFCRYSREDYDGERDFDKILKEIVSKKIDANVTTILLNSMKERTIDANERYIWWNDPYIYSSDIVEYDESDIEIIYNHFVSYIKKIIKTRFFKDSLEFSKLFHLDDLFY